VFYSTRVSPGVRDCCILRSTVVDSINDLKFAFPTPLSRPPPVRIISYMTVSDIPNPFGGPIYRFGEVESTMNEAARLIAEGASHGTVVTAEHQTGGQGRVAGRYWESSPGESLLFTLVLDSHVSGSPFKIPYSLMAALAICRTLEPVVPDVRIKWPNDILLGGKKCAGLLCRSRERFVLVGIGLNCFQTDFAGQYNYPPTSLLLATGKKMSPSDLLPELLEQLHAQLCGAWNTADFTAVMYGHGEKCRVSPGLPERGQILEGIIDGVSERGELLLRRTGERDIVAVASGEIVYCNTD